jgi:alkylation response protein AidB-like acyl-CoA dehydrogenase
LLGGKVIGLPPVLNFGSEELKARIVPDILRGKKFICLAISEAQAGSDVLGLQTTAVKSEDGKEWIVNGSKKWITNGTVRALGHDLCPRKLIFVLSLLTSQSHLVYVLLWYINERLQLHRWM